MKIGIRVKLNKNHGENSGKEGYATNVTKHGAVIHFDTPFLCEDGELNDMYYDDGEFDILDEPVVDWQARCVKLEEALRFYMGVCGNTGYSVTRESALEAYTLGEAALKKVE